jgi:hypothetical protein
MEDAAAEHADGLAQLESRLEARIAALQQQVAADMARTADSLQVSLTFLFFFSPAAVSRLPAYRVNFQSALFHFCFYIQKALFHFHFLSYF